ncbi:MAG: MATE family efflux transporter [Firmicutes bacterium]|nr:MATE family efflux transporter [Bacillota bacterium]
MDKKQKQSNLLSGSIWDKALKFAIPLMLTGMLQQLFNATDVAIVGQFVGPTAMAAVGSNAPIVGLTVNAFIGISVGANVVIARCIGQANSKKVKEAAHTAVMLAIICGLLVAVIGTLVTKPLIGLMGVPEDVRPYSILYMRIYFLGAPFIMLYNFQSAIFRSIGNTKAPLICLAIGGVVNVCSNLFFIIVLNMTVDGVAWATVIANVVSSGLLFILLRREKSDVRIHVNKLRLDRRLMSQMMAIGIPSGIQQMVFALSNLCVQAAVNSLGSEVMAASSGSFYVEIMVYFVLNAFGQTCVTFIGQNYGAGNKKRCRQIFWQLMWINAIFTLVISVLVYVFSGNIMSLFNGDPKIIEYGMVRIKIMMLGQVVNAIMETTSGFLRGLGKSMPPALITLVCVCGVRIGWVYTIFAQYHTWEMLIFVYPLSWVVASVVLMVVTIRAMRKLLSDKMPETTEA